jgi:hypothetical protein
MEYPREKGVMGVVGPKFFIPIGPLANAYTGTYYTYYTHYKANLGGRTKGYGAYLLSSL